MKEMNRKYIETFLGKNVEIVLFDKDVIKGEFHKSGEELFKNNPNLCIPKNYYFVINPQSCLFRSSHIRKIKEVKE